MRKLAAIFAVVAIFGGVFYFSQRSEGPIRYDNQLAWCDTIYHQNVSCPQYGKVKVPAAVLAQQDADHIAWCESIYHQNIGCPKHGQVEVPPAVLAQQKADYLAWCDKIGHRNVGCPEFK